MAANQPHVTPDTIIQHLWSARSAMVLVAGVNLEVFTHIANGKRTVADIARAAKANKRGMEYLIDALVGLDYLTKKGDRYGLTPASEAFLVKGKGTYMGAFTEETMMNYQAWGQLTEVVKTGKPLIKAESDATAREFFPRLVTAIFPMSFGGAQAVARSLTDKQKAKIKKILDVGAGAAPWSIAFAQAIPEARVTVVDYAEVTPIARQYAERFGVADRFEELSGSYHDVNFGRHQYDLAILGHIIHLEGEKRGKKLLKKTAAALREGGMLLIAEMVPNDTRTRPALPLVFGLNMLLHSSEGGVYTMKQYREWLKEAGFTKIWTVDAPAPSPIILATK